MPETKYIVTGEDHTGHPRKSEQPHPEHELSAGTYKGVIVTDGVGTHEFPLELEDDRRLYQKTLTPEGWVDTHPGAPE